MIGRMGYVPIAEPRYSISPSTGQIIYPDTYMAPIVAIPRPGTVSDTVPFVQSPAGGGIISLPSSINPIPVSLTQPQVTAADIYNQPVVSPPFMQQLPPVTAPKPFPWLWVAVGAGALMLMSQKKSKSVGAVNWEKLIVPGAIIIGGYIVLRKLGIFGSAVQRCQQPGPGCPGRNRQSISSK